MLREKGVVADCRLAGLASGGEVSLGIATQTSPKTPRSQVVPGQSPNFERRESVAFARTRPFSLGHDEISSFIPPLCEWSHVELPLARFLLAHGFIRVEALIPLVQDLRQVVQRLFRRLFSVAPSCGGPSYLHETGSLVNWAGEALVDEISKQYDFMQEVSMSMPPSPQ
ncbi:unnamed protein product [Parascedosporium putredinis]|uniref:Uncharacterized protein n=1 Tax=Parascedosporium putredinis TaxID=1442378 RepID=A0A9P1GVM7_9PEZI|nr:unnamed protein product [Parascedosporium putredinis]CAI7988187.1 unnamed protein product [Parascedosporium putredinis]